MSKLTNFLIVLVLIARAGLYIYDHKKISLPRSGNSETSVMDTATSLTEPKTQKRKINTKVVSYTTLTLLVTGDKNIYYYTGPFNGTLFTLNRDYTGTFIKAYKKNMKPEDLMFIIKSDKNAAFKDVIDIMDEMYKNEVPSGQYTEGEITEEESAKINDIKNTKNG